LDKGFENGDIVLEPLIDMRPHREENRLAFDLHFSVGEERRIYTVKRDQMLITPEFKKTSPNLM
jgi:hypothetical protein